MTPTTDPTSPTPLPSALPEADLSFIAGGPLFELYRRAGLAGRDQERVVRRTIALVAFTMVPPFLLAALAGEAEGTAIAIPFLRDIEVHIRFLVGLPLLLAGEVTAPPLIARAVRQFVARDLLPPGGLPRFEAAVGAALRLRDSWLAEAAMVVMALAMHPLWASFLAHGAPTWFSTPGEAGLVLKPAGVWYAYISLPVFRYLALRWLFRFGLWAYFLGRVARIDLRLIPGHPDRAAGLGFLGSGVRAFIPILAAEGALLSAHLATRIFHAGAKLYDLRMVIAAVVASLVVLVLSPLCFFGPQIWRARRAGLGAYGLLAARYVRGFDGKWLGGVAPPEELLGSADIQSLADLANAYGVVASTRPFPFALDTVVTLAVAVLLPVAPLVLTMIPFEDLMWRLAGFLL